MAVTMLPPPPLEGRRPTLLLAEERLGHYPEFSAFFARAFNLDRIGLSLPGCVQAPSGALYLLVFIGRSGEAFPAGVEFYALPEGLEPIDADVADRDLYAILHWMIDGVGAPWSAADFAATARLYRVPAAD